MNRSIVLTFVEDLPVVDRSQGARHGVRVASHNNRVAALLPDVPARVIAGDKALI